MDDRFDLVVIGSGPAGEKGAAQAAYFGKRVALVERAREPGGAAVHTGTLPSKTLRETALYLTGYRARDLYGISVSLDDPRTAVTRLIARKDAIARSESARMRLNIARHGITYVMGHARFVDDHTVEVEAADGSRSRIAGDLFLIASGSRPHRPPEIDFADPDIHDSDEILELDRLPATMTILGGGVIGCEYACMFAALGVDVHLIDTRERILPFLDDEIRSRLTAAIERLGVHVLLGCTWRDVGRDADAIGCTLPDGRRVSSEKLLFAAGRVGNTGALGLDRIGLGPDKRGYLPVDDHFRTTLSHVYAAGDVVGFPCLASVSMEQARVAICHAFQFGYKKSIACHLPYGIYTIPEVSAVGETEESCRAKSIPYVAGNAPYRENPRGQITGDLEGLTKLVVHVPTRRVLGVHVIGERATELVHIGQAVMHLGGTVDAFIEMAFNYPTLSDSFKYAAYAVLGELDRLER